MNNRNTDFSLKSPENWTVDPEGSRQPDKEAKQETTKETFNSNKEQNNNKAASLFNFKEMGVFVRRKNGKTKSTSSANSQKTSHSAKSSALSTSKNLDETLEKSETQSHSKQESCHTIGRENNENASLQKVFLLIF